VDNYQQNSHNYSKGKTEDEEQKNTIRYSVALFNQHFLYPSGRPGNPHARYQFSGERHIDRIGCASGTHQHLPDNRSSHFRPNPLHHTDVLLSRCDDSPR
jgi:hypothetical protein